MIAEPPRERFALIPAVLIGVALLLVALRGSPRERRGGGAGSGRGAGRRAARLRPRRSPARTTSSSATCCRPWSPWRSPWRSASPPAGRAASAWSAPPLLCAYWLAFDVHVTRTPNLQRPDFRDLAEQLGPPRAPARDRHLETRRRPDPVLSRRPLAARLPWRAPRSRDRRGQQAGRGEKAAGAAAGLPSGRTS